MMNPVSMKGRKSLTISDSLPLALLPKGPKRPKDPPRECSLHGSLLGTRPRRKAGAPQ